MDPLDSDLAFAPYTRTGYIDQGRNSDELLAAFLRELPGDGNLPPRWRTDSYDQFLGDYGHLGTVLWSTSYSSHLLVVGGTKVLRIWTDATKHCWVEAPDHVLEAGVPIPEGNRRKSQPFLTRQKFTDPADISALAKRVRMIYGV